MKSMKGCVITHRGFEDVCAREVNELIRAKAELHPSAVTFEIKSYADLCKLSYCMQSGIKVLCLFSLFQFKDETDLLKKSVSAINDSELGEWLGKDSSFRVRLGHSACPELVRSRIESELGAAIVSQARKSLGFEPAVDLDSPEITFFIYACTDFCFLGVDFSGTDISKRDYKIFALSSSPKGSIAYCLLRASGAGKDSVVLDPFCGAGIIPIEAARFSSGFPNNYYFKDKLAFQRLKALSRKSTELILKKADKSISVEGNARVLGFDASLKSVKGAQKNAKIAGIHKQVSFSKVSIEWLDTKLDKESVDVIVTRPPGMGKYADRKETEKTYKELFYQAEFILKKKGVVAAISDKDKHLIEAAEKSSFSLAGKREVWQGQEKKFVLTFARKA